MKDGIKMNMWQRPYEGSKMDLIKSEVVFKDITMQ